MEDFEASSVAPECSFGGGHKVRTHGDLFNDSPLVTEVFQPNVSAHGERRELLHCVSSVEMSIWRSFAWVSASRSLTMSGQHGSRRTGEQGRAVRSRRPNSSSAGEKPLASGVDRYARRAFWSSAVDVRL